MVKLIRKFFPLCLLLLFAAGVTAQHAWQDGIKDPSNFYSIRQAYLKYSAEARTENKNADDEEAKFRRWEYFMEPRVYPSGKIPSPDILRKELNRYKAAQQQKRLTSLDGNWIPLEPASGFPANGYAGRVNCIAFHPLDTNIMYAGLPAGGLWKTTDGGQSWIPLTDDLPSLGVSEILIHPQNPNIMYMATGDKDGAYFISNPYSYGLLKSIDGGITWDTTGLQFLVDSQMTIQRLLIHPTMPNILFAAVTGIAGSLRGIWKSVDNGATWMRMYGGAKYDLEFNPANPAIMYATAYGYLIRSVDTGSTWTTISSPNLPSSGVTSSKVAVTPAQPDIVYIQYLNPSTGNTYGLYKSSDAGVTWVQKNNYVVTLQGGYDWTLTVSPTDSDYVLYGGQGLYYSSDGGTTTGFLSSGHLDHHGMDYRPGSNVLFNCNDGGFFKSYNNGNSWLNLNHGFQTFQYYRLGCSATAPGFILTGAQDNGTWRHNFTSWYQIGYSDGMECIVDYSDTNIYYISSQYGNITRFGTGLGPFTAPPGSGLSAYCAWVTPYLIHPTNPATLFFGQKDIYKTTNRFNSWTSYSTNLTIGDNVGGGMIRSMAISESNPDSVLYAASYVVVYRTIDGGATWQNVTSNLPTSAGCFNCSALSDIMIHQSNPDIAWVTMSGYSPGNRVFKTADGGASWTNISGTLPVVPVNCIVYQNNSDEGLYIGTDIGVFYRDSTMSDWIPFMTGLPNVPVQELEIHYGTNRIRAATFGRGLWESDLYGINASANNSAIENIPDFSVQPNPSNGIFIIKLKNGTVHSRLNVYNVLGENIHHAQLNSDAVEIDLSSMNDGIYLLSIETQQFVQTQKLVVAR